ncbi:MAG: HAMP domain-containing histidine kinase [Actinomycetia bacterium]|nr:HAMP domain-containing histidine kinase [Actinomycetes bacterium]
MKLRTRVALLTAIVTAVAVVLVSYAAWLSANRAMRDSIDSELAERAASIAPASGGGRSQRPFLAGAASVQFIDQSGAVVQLGELAVPVTDAEVEIAAERRGAIYRDATATTADGEALQVRVLTVPARIPGNRLDGAVMLARPLSELDDSLGRLRGALVVLSLAGVAVAGLAGFAIGHRALRPVARLTRAAEGVSRTRELATRIEVERDDELGRLAHSFNTMLAALEQSKDQQERLVHDASHELRTPLTSLRTNIELLQRADSFSVEQRRPILDDVLFELDELTGLVSELVELATDRHRPEEAEPLDLEEVVRLVVERHRRRSPISIELEAEPTSIVGVPALVERAVSNLVDNAIKFSPDEGIVRVRVADCKVVVSDEGPGIDPADRNLAFERFWRAPTARTMPGSGLGLSIVAQVAESHGGKAEVIDGETTGATVSLSFAPPS